MSYFSHLLSSPPAPTFTEASLIDLSTKVYIITETTSHDALALTKILYRLHATVYVGAHSRKHFDETYKLLSQECPNSKGALKPFIFDSVDLSTIKPVAKKVLEEQWRLDVLFFTASPNSNDTDHTAHVLASFLLASLLLPLMEKTTSHFCHPNPSIRVVWTTPSPSNSKSTSGACVEDSTGAPQKLNTFSPYLLAHEFSRRKHSSAPLEVGPHAHTLPNSNPSGVQHVTVALFSPPPKIQAILHNLVPSSISKARDYGAFTLLFAGLAPDVRTGHWIVPWGQKGSVPKEVEKSTVGKEHKEGSVSARSYAWCEEQVRPYL
jgi:retinol dehydrogenase-12